MSQEQLNNHIYLNRFSHTKALLLKKYRHKTDIFPVLQNLTHMFLHFLFDFRCSSFTKAALGYQFSKLLYCTHYTAPSHLLIEAEAYKGAQFHVHSHTGPVKI